MTMTTLVWRNLLRRRGRSTLTILGIGIAIGTMIAQVSITRGFDITIEKILETRQAQIMVTKRESPDPIFSSLPEAMGRELVEVPHVRGVIGVLVDMVTLEDQPGVAVFGYRHEGQAASHLRFPQGRNVAGAGRHEIVIGWSLAERMKKKVGDTLHIEVDLYDLVGVYESGNMIEDNSAALALEDLQGLMGRPGQVTLFNLVLDDPARVEDVKRSIEARFPKSRALAAEDAAAAMDTIQVAKVMAWVLSLVAVVVGGLATMNTMLMSVLERTREIGILRALGWRRRRIFSLILAESLVLAVLGWIMALAIGPFGVFAINEIPRVSGTLPGRMDAALVLESLAVATLLGALGAIYPAHRASHVPPIEALRYE